MKITFTDLKQTIEKLAEESPDCTYKNSETCFCSYYKGTCSNGSSGCIVGQACRILGFSEEDLVGMDRHGAFMEVAKSVEFKKRFSLSSKEIDWVSVIQQEQDCPNSWSKAVLAANQGS